MTFAPYAKQIPDELIGSIRTAMIVTSIIGIVLGVPGVRDALRGTSAKIVGITPDLTDLGPSLAAVGIEPTADAVSALYRDLRATWLAADASPADVLTHA